VIGETAYKDMFYINVAILLAALLLDLSLGEPPSKIHPTVIIGRITELISSRIGIGNPIYERLAGIGLSTFVISLSAITAYLIATLSTSMNPLLGLIVSAGLLKTTLAVKSMISHALPILVSLTAGKVEEARKLVGLIVRRDTKNLREGHISSAAIESVAESLVDGILSPIFYYSLLGVSGAMSYRAINTLDSMIGYKERRYLYLGWFAAKLDTLANYVTARIAALMIVVSSMILRLNWRGAITLCLKEHNKTPSVNAGWPIAAMAGALSIRLEKLGYYSIGEDLNLPEPRHISYSIKVMLLSTLLFVIIVAIPLMYLRGVMIGYVRLP